MSTKLAVREFVSAGVNEASGDPTASRFLAGRQIMVVDDDKALLLAITKVLRQHGARVLSASNVSEAVSYLTQGSGALHLVLTDMRMPIVSGKLVLSAMRGSAPHVPTIVMTAHATPMLREECAALGVAAFIEKPFGISDLITLIRTVIERDPPP